MGTPRAGQDSRELSGPVMSVDPFRRRKAGVGTWTWENVSLHVDEWMEKKKKKEEGGQAISWYPSAVFFPLSN